MVSKEVASKSFFKAWSKSYDKGLLSSALRRWQRKTVSKINTSGKILDVGCGSGYALELLHKKFPRSELYGIDLTPEMLVLAKNRLPSSVKLQEGVAQSLPFKDNFFDVVMCNESLHHHIAQQKSIQEMVRVCKKGGMVMVSDPEVYFRWVHWIFEKVEPGCVRVNTKREMRVLFEKAGLKNIHQERIGWFSVLTVGTK